MKLFVEVKVTGQSMLITKHGDPIAIVSPVPPEVENRSAFGALRDSTRVNGDILEPIDSQDWEVLSS